MGTEENVKPDGTPEREETPKIAGEEFPGEEAPEHANDYPRGASTWPVPGALNHQMGSDGTKTAYYPSKDAMSNYRDSMRMNFPTGRGLKDSRTCFSARSGNGNYSRRRSCSIKITSREEDGSN